MGGFAGPAWELSSHTCGGMFTRRFGVSLGVFDKTVSGQDRPKVIVEADNVRNSPGDTQRWVQMLAVLEGELLGAQGAAVCVF